MRIIWVIWRRVAPMARSIPISWRRSIMMVRKVLKIRNAPMNNASAASTLNIAKATCIEPTASSPPVALAFITYCSPSAACTAAVTAPGSAPASNAISMALINPGWLSADCASLSVIVIAGAAALPCSAVSPETVYSRRPPAVINGKVVPIFNSGARSAMPAGSSALPVSPGCKNSPALMTTSRTSGAVAGSMPTSSIWGALPTALSAPKLSCGSDTWRRSTPVAAFTPGTPATISSGSSGENASPVMLRTLKSTVPVAALRECLKASMALGSAILKANISATPNTIEVVVNRVRSLRPRM
jgi:hypothetical protein